jgi:hypothetical protein
MSNTWVLCALIYNRESTVEKLLQFIDRVGVQNFEPETEDGNTPLRALFEEYRVNFVGPPKTPRYFMVHHWSLEQADGVELLLDTIFQIPGMEVNVEYPLLQSAVATRRQVPRAGDMTSILYDIAFPVSPYGFYAPPYANHRNIVQNLLARGASADKILHQPDFARHASDHGTTVLLPSQWSIIEVCVEHELKKIQTLLLCLNQASSLPSPLLRNIGKVAREQSMSQHFYVFYKMMTKWQMSFDDVFQLFEDRNLRVQRAAIVGSSGLIGLPKSYTEFVHAAYSE